MIQNTMSTMLWRNSLFFLCLNLIILLLEHPKWTVQDYPNLEFTFDLSIFYISIFILSSFLKVRVKFFTWFLPISRDSRDFEVFYVTWNRSMKFTWIRDHVNHVIKPYASFRIMEIGFWFVIFLKFECKLQVCITRAENV